MPRFASGYGLMGVTPLPPAMGWRRRILLLIKISTGLICVYASRNLLRGQADLGDVQLLQYVQHADHALVIRIVSALNNHA
jgi:hypothetical protein